MKEVIYIGEDCILGRFGFVRKGAKLEVTPEEFAYISEKSADQFDLKSGKASLAPDGPSTASGVSEAPEDQTEAAEASGADSGETEAPVVVPVRRRRK